MYHALKARNNNQYNASHRRFENKCYFNTRHEYYGYQHYESLRRLLGLLEAKQELNCPIIVIAILCVCFFKGELVVGLIVKFA